MEGVFLEFENENGLRSYPFAAGCVPPADEQSRIPSGVFVDAALYPVNPSGILYLSGISEDGVFRISDDTGVIMSGTASGRVVEMYDLSAFRRHVGTLVAESPEALESIVSYGVDRAYARNNTAFASSCVFPVVVDGVTSVSVGGEGPVDGEVSFENGQSDDIRVSSGSTADGRSTLRFDVLPRPRPPEGVSIRRIICVVDGQTPFRINKSDMAYNTVFLKLDDIDKAVVCAAAHRENEYEMADTCECHKDPLPDKEPLPDTYQIEEVFIPPDEEGTEGGVQEGADNAFYLVTPNMGNYDNPLSITLEDGAVVPNVEGPEVVVDGNVAELADGAMKDEVGSKGVVIQVPGLLGGMS